MMACMHETDYHQREMLQEVETRGMGSEETSKQVITL